MTALTSALPVPADGYRASQAGGLGAGRVGDVPALHQALVHPRGQHGRPVRRPPEAAGPAHLLGRHVLSAPEQHRVRFAGLGRRDRAVVATGHARHAQLAAAGVSDQRARRVRPRIRGRGRGGQLPDRLARLAAQAGQVDPAGQGERRDGEVPVGGKADDATRGLAHPLPAGLLQHVVLPGRPVHLERVGHQPLGAAGHVQRPQAGDLIRAAPRAQEHHQVAVRGELERPGRAEREALGPGLLPGKRVRHSRRYCQHRCELGQSGQPGHHPNGWKMPGAFTQHFPPAGHPS